MASWWLKAQSPSSDAAASKRRPSPELGRTVDIFVAASRRRRRASPRRAARRARAGVRRPPAPKRSQSQARAQRPVSRAAASPPGSRSGRRRPSRADAARIAQQDLAAPRLAVGAVPHAVADQPDRRRSVRPCSASNEARWAWWCWTSCTRHGPRVAPSVPRVAPGEVAGMGVARDPRPAGRRTAAPGRRSSAGSAPGPGCR